MGSGGGGGGASRRLALPADPLLAGRPGQHACLLAYGCTMPLFEWPQVRPVSKRLQNYAADPSLSMDIWNAADWWLTG